MAESRGEIFSVSFHINQQCSQSFNSLPVVAHANVLIGLMLVVVVIDDGDADSRDIQHLSEDIEGDGTTACGDKHHRFIVVI